MATVDKQTKTLTVDGVDEVIEWVDHDDRSFYTHLFKATTQPPVATMTLVHGLCEHIDRYEDMARSFARSGIQVLGFDQRGFGKTGRQCGVLGDNEGLDTVASDIASMNNRVSIEGVPHFLFGHSMGGLNVLNFCMQKADNIKGVIASAPALLPGKPLMPPRIVQYALHQVVRFFPSIQKNTGIETDMMTSNQAELKKFNASIENLSHCTLKTIANLIKGGPNVIKNAGEFKTPVFLIHADGDRATDPDGTRQFFEGLPESLDKEYKEVSNAYHELHFEEDLDFDLLNTYKQWILSRLD
ncbi:hypothetical protein IW146_003769 [Coemansia sp. RSA 922]|nr:hypothetical protein H4S03_001635 [Coemansia sp. S3946]KAJ2052948.1 hypothetical protein H4S04_001013 [Coemansia sp. S16]KAJ2113568.1 hypothetical protein IW146_003769 [Coemansia sp. RSA 922]KAJ2332491.1 hypothetical protein GGH92_008907 [Coemansia sp. RSA 2673]